MMQRLRKTKVVATLGSASQDFETLKQLVKAGVDVLRLNFSHSTHEEHGARVKTIRAVEKELGYPLGILCDLQGPKLRVGTFQGGSTVLKEGDPFVLDLKTDVPGTDQRVSFPHGDIFSTLKPGLLLLLDDGKLALEIQKIEGSVIRTVVKCGGVLSDRKGVNVPGVALPISALTPKDLADLEFIKTLDIDFIGLSFVQSPEDVKQLRALILDHHQIFAKIEKPQALPVIDQILEVSDGIMVARGDLGIEIPLEQVPGQQKHLIQRAKHYGKPVIVATQMLESMIVSATPTRAEVSDVANAVYDDADAVMLSAESAMGKYPLEAVSIMNRILETTEGESLYNPQDEKQGHPTVEDAITLGAKQVAETVGADVMVTCSMTGKTAARASKHRPRTRILCLTPHQKTARRLTLYWGVYSHVMEIDSNIHGFLEKVRGLPYFKKGDYVVITGGSPLGASGTTNFVYVEKITQ